LKTLPHNAKLHYNFANFLRDTGQLELATKHYREALRWVKMSLRNFVLLVELFSWTRLELSCDVVTWFPAERLLMGTSSFWNSRSEVSCLSRGISWKSLYIFAPVFSLCEIECDSILSCVNRADIVTNIYVQLLVLWPQNFEV